MRVAERRLRARRPLAAASRQTSGVRVLVIEDEVRLAEAIGRGLRAEGFEVDLAHTGPDGLWRAVEGAYSAIVLDILLPGLNGYAVCRDLRAQGDRTPVLMLTAKQGEHDEAEGLELGADDFLRKPFSFVVLVARLRALDPAGDERARRRARHRRPARRPRQAALLARPERDRADGARAGAARSPSPGATAAWRRRPSCSSEVWGFDFDG